MHEVLVFRGAGANRLGFADIVFTEQRQNSVSKQNCKVRQRVSRVVLSSESIASCEPANVFFFKKSHSNDLITFRVIENELRENALFSKSDI